MSIAPRDKSRFGPAFALAICAVIVSTAQAQVEVEASSISYSSDCILGHGAGAGIRNVYVRLTFNDGATAARFRMALGPGVTMTYVSESTPYASAGSALAGISICFGSCLEQEPLIDTVTFMSYGDDAACSEVRIVPHPDAQTVEVRRCNGSTVAAYAQNLAIRPPGAFPCQCPSAHLFPGAPFPFDCMPVSVENTTWGSVKALYRN